MKKRSLLFSIFTFLTLMALMPGLRVESQAATSTTKLTISSYSSTDTAIRINWNQVSSASGYVVYRYSGGEYVIIAEISGSSITTYRDSGLNDDSAYLYKVAAYFNLEISKFGLILVRFLQQKLMLKQHRLFPIAALKQLFESIGTK